MEMDLQSKKRELNPTKYMEFGKHTTTHSCGDESTQQYENEFIEPPEMMIGQ